MNPTSVMADDSAFFCPKQETVKSHFIINEHTTVYTENKDLRA